MTEKFPDFYARLREYQVRTWANKLMLPTEAAALEAVVMETWLDDEIKCASLHTDHGPCSIEVTHYLTDCVTAGFLCANSAEYVQRAKDANLDCAGCGEPCGDHIRLTAI